MRFTIGGKILGITVALLALMAVVCGVSTHLIAREQGRLLLVAEGFSPMVDAVVDYRRAALRRQMHLAKLLRLLDAAVRDDAAVKEQRTQWEAEVNEARGHLDAARAGAAKLGQRTLLPRERDELVRLPVTLDELLARSVENVEQARIQVAATQRRDTAALPAINAVAAKAESDMLVAGATNVEASRALMHDMLVEVVAEQGRIVWLSYLTTAIAALLGVVFSMAVTRGMVRPVNALMQAVRRVQEGNLTVDLPVLSTDEIGTLTQSFNHMIVELRAKQRLKDTFGKYVDPRVVETLMAQGADAAGGQREVMTIFFSDLVGFTSISERLTPSGLVNVMNRYLSLMSAPIRAHQGLIDKYIGDAIMAFWGPPFTGREEHARLACFAALDQLKALEEFRAMLPELMGLRKGLPEVDFRIGISTGDVVVGNIGSDVTRAFTVLGDTVNLGSRLEGASKQYGTRVLISEETERMARGAIETREVDRIAVKGKSDPVRVFELMGRAGELTAAQAELRDRFEKGLESYRARDWAAARAQFEACLRDNPADGPSKVYVERVRILEATPPPAEWDGVWHLTQK